MKSIVKLILPFSLCLILLLVLTGCGGSNDEEQTALPEEQGAPETIEPQEHDIEVSEPQSHELNEFQDSNLSLKWVNEDIGDPEKIVVSDGKIYAQVADVEGPVLYIVDVDSGAVLESKNLRIGHTILGASQDAVYFDAESYFYAVDKGDWNELWRKDQDERDKIIVTKNGLIYKDREFIYLIKDNINQPLAKFGRESLPKAGSFIAFHFMTGPDYWHARGLGDNFVYLSSHVETDDHTEIKINQYDLATGNKSGSVMWVKYDRQLREEYEWVPLAERNNNLLAVMISQELQQFLRKIGLLDMYNGQFKWISDELEIYLKEEAIFYDDANDMLIVFGNVKHGDVSYTVWYGIDASNGKIVWKKQIRADDPHTDDKQDIQYLYIRERRGDEWVDIINGVLVVGRDREEKLVFVDALSGDILGQAEVPTYTDRWRRTSVNYKQYEDKLIVTTNDDLRCYLVGK